MGRYVAFLRAVNLAGHGKVGMAELAALCTSLGFGKVKTLLNSGNVIFSAEDRASADLEAQLESEAAKQLDLRTDIMVRSSAQLSDSIAANPFPAEAKDDPSHLLVVFLKAPAGDDAVSTLQAGIKGRELVRAAGRQLYVTYPDGIGTSKLTMPAIESKLGTRGTGRNWNTVLKLQAVLGSGVA